MGAVHVAGNVHPSGALDCSSLQFSKLEERRVISLYSTYSVLLSEIMIHCFFFARYNLKLPLYQLIFIICVYFRGDTNFIGVYNEKIHILGYDNIR